MNSLKYNLNYLKLSFVFLFLLLSTISCSDEQSNNINSEEINNTRNSYILLKNNWEFSIKQNLKDSVEWQNIQKLPLELDENKKDEQRTIFLKYQLPDIQYQNPAIFMGFANRYFQAYFNDSLIYSFKDIIDDKKNKVKSKYFSMHIINLQNYNNNNNNNNNISGKKNLVLKMKLKNYSTETNFIPSDFIFLNSIGNIYQNIYKNDFIKVFSSLFLILISFVAISISIYLKNIWSFLELNLFVFFFGVYLFANANISSLFIDKPYIMYYLDVPILFISSILMFSFVNRLIIDKYKIYFRIITIIHIIVSVILFTLDLFAVLFFEKSLHFYFIILLLSIFVAIFIFIKKPFKKNNFHEIFFIGLSFFSGFAIIEIVLFLLSINFTIMGLNLSFLHLGALALVLSWSILYLFKYINVYEEYIHAHENFSRKIFDSQNNERKRIAQNLHDATGHDLLIIKNLSQLAIDNNAEGKDISDQIRKISEISDEAVARIRVICKSLYPPVLENLGLTKALRGLVDNSFKSNNIKYNLELENIDDYFIKSDDIHIYRIIQEIFNNILKHSKATEIDITFKEENEILIITIIDNGTGMEEQVINNIESNSEGFGLTGITERVQIFKGKFNLENLVNNKGLKITIELPFNRVPVSF